MEKETSNKSSKSKHDENIKEFVTQWAQVTRSKKIKRFFGCKSNAEKVERFSDTKQRGRKCKKLWNVEKV